jgi:CheY-like chemotaxis protein
VSSTHVAIRDLTSRMPVMDGRQSAREIRRLEKAGKIKQGSVIQNHIPIIAVSASLYESDRFEMAEAFDGWLLKPLGESSAFNVGS